MKKLLGIVVLGLLFCNASFAGPTFTNQKKFWKGFKPWVGMTLNQLCILHNNHSPSMNWKKYRFQLKTNNGWYNQEGPSARCGTIYPSYGNNTFPFSDGWENTNRTILDPDGYMRGTIILKILTGNKHYYIDKNTLKITKIDTGQYTQANKNNTQSVSGSFTAEIGIHSVTCKELGFKHGTEKFGDCVLKLVELDIKRGGNVQVAEQFQRKRQDQGSQMLIELGLGLLSGSSGSTTQTQTNTNQRSTCRWQSGGVGQPYMTCTTY